MSPLACLLLANSSFRLDNMALAYSVPWFSSLSFLSGSLFQLTLFQKKRPTSAAEIFSHMPWSSRFRVLDHPEFLTMNLLSVKEPRLAQQDEPCNKGKPYVNSNKMVPLLILFLASADSEFSFASSDPRNSSQFLFAQYKQLRTCRR